ncbi:MAG TPA: VOC family protein [Thermomicrobiales bacterium]|nr:VOC family protein [Thermomicrobiales bacterium]
MGIIVKVLFIAGFGPVVPDMGAARAFYAEALGLPLEGDADYLQTSQVDGARQFALWPLSEAARSCFGTEQWPADVPAPQGWLEFDVDDVAAATAELTARGYRVLVANRMEPWGQTVSRLLGPEGLLVGVTYTPDLRARA